MLHCGHIAYTWIASFFLATSHVASMYYVSLNSDLDPFPAISFGTKGTTINDLGVGPEEIEEKKFGGPSAGKNKLQRAFHRKK